MLSFVIPTYNRKNFLRKCIDSIMLQKIKNYEIILVDDCSNDRTFEFIQKEYPKIKIIKNEKNMGSAYSRNIGFKEAKGDYILFIDSDVYLEKNAVKNLLEQAEKNDITYPLINFSNGLKMYPSREKEKNYLYITTVFLIKRNSIKKLDSLFDTNYLFNYEDLDFFIRCNFFGLKMKYCYDSIAIHAEQKTSEDWEKRYYCELYGILYALIKLRKILTKTSMENDFNFNILSKKLICSFFNFNTAHYFIEKGSRSKIQKIKDVLFDKKRKISNKGILFIYYLTFKAFYKSLINLPNTLKQKRKLEQFIKNENIAN